MALKEISRIGIKPLENPRDKCQITHYLISVLLKGCALFPSELSQISTLSLKTSQRYFYNTRCSDRSLVDLDTLSVICELTGISLIDFFKNVQMFEENNSIAAVYTKRGLVLLSKDQLHNDCFDEQKLTSLLKQRHKIVMSYGLKEHNAEFLVALSQFPEQLLAKQSELEECV